MAIKLLLGSSPEDCRRGNTFKAYINNRIGNGEKSIIELSFHDYKCSDKNHNDKTV